MTSHRRPFDVMCLLGRRCELWSHFLEPPRQHGDDDVTMQLCGVSSMKNMEIIGLLVDFSLTPSETMFHSITSRYPDSEREKREMTREKKCKQSPPASTANTVGLSLYQYPN